MSPALGARWRSKSASPSGSASTPRRRGKTSALGAIAAVNPGALLFGTDLPSTRARRPFLASDLDVLADALGDEALLRGAQHDNARRLYRL